MSESSSDRWPALAAWLRSAEGARETPSPDLGEAVTPAMVFGLVMKESRRRSGMSQRNWAKHLGDGNVITDSYLGLVEAGQRIPSEEKTLRLAEAIGVPADVLLEARTLARWSRANDELAKLGSGVADADRVTQALIDVDAEDILPRRRGRPSKADLVRRELIVKLTDLPESELLRISGFVDGLIAARD